MLDKLTSEEKTNYIFSELAKGVEREVISEELGYKTFKSMDNFVRRQGYAWDGRTNTYFRPEDKNNGRYAKPVLSTRGKVGEVIKQFSKEGSDAKDIAKDLGFEDHRDLAIYMTTKGCIWDSEIGNYRLETGKASIVKDDLEEPEVKLTFNHDIPANRGYEELLDYLLHNEDKLRHLLNAGGPVDSEGSIPRYAIPGVFVTKSVHMTSHLDQLVRDFSKERNISQRELFEVALVEFFQKYGYEDEIDVLMKQV